MKVAREVIRTLITSTFSQLPVALFYKPAEIQTARREWEKSVLVWREGGQRESKEDEREDSRVKEASLVDRRENCSGDGREEKRTDEARVEGERDFRLRREVTI